MKSVVKLIKEYKLSSKNVISFLTTLGFKNVSLNTKVDTSIENQIINHFVKKPKQEYKIENPELITVFTENLFDSLIQFVKHPKYNPINSYFTDEQAKHVCHKMSNKRIRHFSNLFLTDAKNIDKITLKYQIHYLSNKALEFYGGRILTFIYKLKNWATRVSNVEVLKMNQNGVYDFDTNFPKLEIQSYESDKQFTIRFTRAYERQIGNYSALKIINNRNNITARVSINGQLIDDFENCIPEIALFKESLNESFVLYSGYDDEYCDICGRRLEDPISIKYGRGPTCRNNWGLP